MPQVTQEWAFDEGLDGFAPLGSTPEGVLVWDESDGDPTPGCLAVSYEVGGGGNRQFGLTTTWEALGVPPGATVTGFEGSLRTRVTQPGNVNCYIEYGVFDVALTAPVPNLGVEQMTAAHGWQAAPDNGPVSDVPALLRPSDTPIMVWLGVNGNVAYIVKFDTLTLTIAYSEPVEPEPSEGWPGERVVVPVEDRAAAVPAESRSPSIAAERRRIQVTK